MRVSWKRIWRGSGCIIGMGEAYLLDRFENMGQKGKWRDETTGVAGDFACVDCDRFGDFLAACWGEWWFCGLGG